MMFVSAPVPVRRGAPGAFDAKSERRSEIARTTAGKTADVCRKHGISSATLYAWKANYGGLDVSQARKLKVLEEETYGRGFARSRWSVVASATGGWASCLPARGWS